MDKTRRGFMFKWVPGAVVTAAMVPTMLLSSCGEKSRENTEEGWLKYTSPRFGFTQEYPETLTLNTEMKGFFRWYGPRSVEGRMYTPWYTVSVEPTDEYTPGQPETIYKEKSLNWHGYQTQDHVISGHGEVYSRVITTPKWTYTIVVGVNWDSKHPFRDPISAVRGDTRKMIDRFEVIGG